MGNTVSMFIYSKNINNTLKYDHFRITVYTTFHYIVHYTTIHKLNILLNILTDR